MLYFFISNWIFFFAPNLQFNIQLSKDKFLPCSKCPVKLLFQTLSKKDMFLTILLKYILSSYVLYFLLFKYNVTVLFFVFYSVKQKIDKMMPNSVFFISYKNWLTCLPIRVQTQVASRLIFYHFCPKHTISSVFFKGQILLTVFWCKLNNLNF